VVGLAFFRDPVGGRLALLALKRVPDLPVGSV
jgi:hypothetical protein